MFGITIHACINSFVTCLKHMQGNMLRFVLTKSCLERYVFPGFVSEAFQTLFVVGNYCYWRLLDIGKTLLIFVV